MTQPPTRPAPRAPRRGVDVEALIKEARRRQRRRQALIAAVVVAVVAGAAIVVHGLNGGNAARGRAAGGASAGVGARATLTTPFAVGAAILRPGKQWGGLVIARPGAQSCTLVPLPDSYGGVVFSGRRYAYHVGGDGSKVIAVGVVGRGLPHRFVARYLAWPQSFSIFPVWLDGRLGLLESNAPRLHLAGRTITFHVPPGAQFGGVLSSSHGRILYDVLSQNVWGTAVTKTATFVYANGVTKLVRNSPEPDGGLLGSGEDSWSPDGSRIAFVERGGLWTMRADGSDTRRLTPTRTAGAPLLWSADGKTIVYGALRDRVSDAYSVPARGGEPRQLTHSQALPPPVNGGTRPLVWLGPTALAVASGNSLGVVDLGGGPVRTVCKLPSMSFTSATALR